MAKTQPASDVTNVSFPDADAPFTGTPAVTPSAPMNMPAGMMGGMEAFFAKMFETMQKAFTQGMPPRQITMGQYDPKTPYHPNKKTAQHFRRRTYQNGIELSYSTNYDGDIEMCNRINRPGTYCEGRVDVQIVNPGMGSAEYINFLYDNATADHRLDNKSIFRSFTEMLQIILAKQDELDAVEERRKQFEAEMMARPRATV